MGVEGSVGRGERVVERVTGWVGVTTDVGRFGEIEFFVGGHMIGHVHGDHMGDIPFPRALRDELVDAGRVEPHHIHPDSGWTTRYLRTDADADAVVELIRLNYERVAG